MNEFEVERQNSPKGLFLPGLLILMSIYPPLSTDMYLPAITEIAGDLHTSDATINLTLVLFFIFFAFSTLLWGPISDKFGRKKSVMAGIACYTVSSLVCVVTTNVHVLIVARVFQAIGSGAPVTIAIAIVQDVYTGDSKKKILSALSALMMVVPVVAPLLGSFILIFSNWRVVFVILTALGVISLVGCLRLTETNRNINKDIPVIGAMMGIFRVSSNKSFTILLILFSLPAFFALGFVGGSSFIYMKEFGITPRMFSLFFGINSVFAVLGAVIYVPISKKYTNNQLVTRAIIIIALCGVLIMFLGSFSPLAFCLCVIPGTLVSAMLRPITFEMLMAVGGSETGSISALINFMFPIFGSIGMQIIAFQWESRAQAYGIMTIIMAIACAAIWFYVLLEKHKTAKDATPQRAGT